MTEEYHPAQQYKNQFIVSTITTFVTIVSAVVISGFIAKATIQSEVGAATQTWDRPGNVSAQSQAPHYYPFGVNQSGGGGSCEDSSYHNGYGEGQRDDWGDRSDRSERADRRTDRRERSHRYVPAAHGSHHEYSKKSSAKHRTAAKTKVERPKTVHNNKHYKSYVTNNMTSSQETNQNYYAYENSYNTTNSNNSVTNDSSKYVSVEDSYNGDDSKYNIEEKTHQETNTTIHNETNTEIKDSYNHEENHEDSHNSYSDSHNTSQDTNTDIDVDVEIDESFNQSEETNTSTVDIDESYNDVDESINTDVEVEVEDSFNKNDVEVDSPLAATL